jgi:hypothetical protein
LLDLRRVPAAIMQKIRAMKRDSRFHGNDGESYESDSGKQNRHARAV